MTPSASSDLDAALATLQQTKHAWVVRSVRERIALVDQLIRDSAELAPQWVIASVQGKGIPTYSAAVCDEWATGPYSVLRNLVTLRRALVEIETLGRPRVPGGMTTRVDGQVVARVFPQTIYDRLFYRGLTIEVWMEPGASITESQRDQALAYQRKLDAGKVSLVLGAGNISCGAICDALYKLFVENQVVVVKMHPVNAYLGPMIERSLQALIKLGVLRIVYGGEAEGAYLCHHHSIDEIHLTGSYKTFESIVFGPGPEGFARKAAGERLVAKRVSGELGNVTPVIVVPGPWNTADLAYIAEEIATMMTSNAGCNCAAGQVIVQHADWSQREGLLAQIRDNLRNVPSRVAFYPGAQERRQAFLSAHPEAEQFGATGEGRLPWTLIADVDANKEDPCFSSEAFCGLLAETGITATSFEDYLEQAVKFVNQRLWGTLTATLLVHPASLCDSAAVRALDRAIGDLRYGTVAINSWGAISYALGIAPWAGFPGNCLNDIQSGNTAVHNSLMFSHAQKTVIRAPFRTWPKPLWFQSRGRSGALVLARLCEFEASGSLWKLPGILWAALQG